MAEERSRIFNGDLVANSLNYSDSFSGANFLYLLAPDNPDWSQNGEFIEIDFDLLVTIEGGFKRRVPLELFASTRELVRIPQEFSAPGCSMQFVMQASFSVKLEVWAVAVPVEVPAIDFEQEFERIRALINLILFLTGGPTLPSLPGIPAPDLLPDVDWFPAIPGTNP